MSSSPPVSVAHSKRSAVDRSRHLSRTRVREALQGYTFISPWFVGFLAFTVGPLLASLYYSFNQYGLLRTPQWIGFDNYSTAFFGDSLFWKSVERTTLWSITLVPLGIVGSFCAALLLDRGIKGTTVWRICFFLPSLTPSVAAVLVWMWILQPEIGVVNSLLRMAFGIKGPGWMASPDWAFPSLLLVSLWGSIGSNRMLIFLAGLQGIPAELYDASMVDGANWWQKVCHVTIPMISPTIFFNLVLGMIGSLQVFGVAFIGTKGGPAYATHFYALHLYKVAFQNYDMGYGSALAWLLFLTILVLTLLQVRTSERWVFYSGA